jgi:Post-segregation antitoxin CcdA/PIN domain
MRTTRVNLTVPDELLDQARAAGLNVSRLAAGALAEEIDRRTKVAELDVYLAALEAELGPVPEQELDAARQWADPCCPLADRHRAGVAGDAGPGRRGHQRPDRAAGLANRTGPPWAVAPQVPAVVLAEALTGDHRRDFHADRLLRACQIRDVTEPCAREAARLRTATGQAAAISATDAIVAAYASVTPDPVVLTSDPHGLTALAQHANRPITIAPFSCCHPAHPPRRTLQLTHSHAE